MRFSENVALLLAAAGARVAADTGVCLQFFPIFGRDIPWGDNIS